MPDQLAAVATTPAPGAGAKATTMARAGAPGPDVQGASAAPGGPSHAASSTVPSPGEHASPADGKSGADRSASAHGKTASKDDVKAPAKDHAHEKDHTHDKSARAGSFADLLAAGMQQVNPPGAAVTAGNTAQAASSPGSGKVLPARPGPVAVTMPPAAAVGAAVAPDTATHALATTLHGQSGKAPVAGEGRDEGAPSTQSAQSVSGAEVAAAGTNPAGKATAVVAAASGDKTASEDPFHKLLSEAHAPAPASAPAGGDASAQAAAHAAAVSAPRQPAVATPVQTHVDTALGSNGWNAAFGNHVAVLASNGVHHAQLTLNPPHLGRVEVHISVHHGDASISLGSQHADVRDAMQAALPRLREMLGMHGLNLAQADVSQHAFGGGGGGQAPRPPLTPLPGATPTTLEADALPGHVRVGLLDHYV